MLKMAKLRNILVFCLLSFSVAVYGQVTFRGAWIATVANIDWPSEAAVGDSATQQHEMIFILDSLHSLGLNAIIFQVRPTADALYRSSFEPSSHWLTGTQGSSLTWDPLAWTIEEAHKRQMEVHVWLNPYRVNLAKTDTSVICEDHIWKKHRDWFWEYNKQWYFDPGLDVTREWICTIVQDIISRYDIQAIHMDDYFYPYPVGKKQLPDAETFARYPRGFTDIREWRRNNVNMAIQEISATIRECKDSVEFGISPFGVWRNANVDSTGSATTAGITNYDDLYADIRLWIKKGWIDYVLPQLYWEIGKKAADYEVLAHWWANEVRGTKCKLYIGMAPYRLEGAKKDSPWGQGNEIGRQMTLNRTIPEITGECFYSTRPLLRNPRGVCDTIRAIYRPVLSLPQQDDEEEGELILPWE
jgi:uncharacterized lipoprotein YddW (UPF0748 family)